MKIIHFTVKEPQFCGSFSFLAWEQRKLNELVTYHSSNLTASDSSHIGNYDLYDANQIIGKTNVEPMKTEYITIIKDGAGVGRIRIMPKNTMFIGTMGGLQANKSNIQFIFSLLTRFDLGKEFSGSTIPHIYFKDYGNNNYYVPFTEEQHAIGEFFTKIDNLITLHQCKFYLEKCGFGFTEKVAFNRILAHDWEQRKLGDIGTTYTGLSGKSKEDFGHGYAKFVTYMNVFSNPVSSPTMIESVEIDDNQNCVLQGDVLFTTSSETPEEVGMSSVWLENMQNTYLNSFCFGYRPTTKLNPYYLAYMLRSSSIRKKIVFLAQGISRYNISKNKMMEIKIHIPELKEQELIGECFRNLDSLITLHQCVLIKFKEHYYDKRNKQKRITYRLF